MKIRTKPYKVSGSLFVRIPCDIRNQLEISKNDILTIDIENGKMTVEKAILESVRK